MTKENKTEADEDAKKLERLKNKKEKSKEDVETLVDLMDKYSIPVTYLDVPSGRKQREEEVIAANRMKRIMAGEPFKTPRKHTPTSWGISSVRKVLKFAKENGYTKQQIREFWDLNEKINYLSTQANLGDHVAMDLYLSLAQHLKKKGGLK